VLPIELTVAISHRQRRVVGRELRDLVFRVCSGGGAFIGLMWALKHTNTHPSRSQVCRPHITTHEHVLTHAFAQCVGSSLASEILAWLTPVLVGGGVGAIIGFLLASMIRLGRKPSGKIRQHSPTASTAGGRWIRARYPRKCRRCGCSVMPGDRIRHQPGHVLCASCGEHT